MSKSLEELQREYEENTVKLEQEKRKLRRLENRKSYLDSGSRKQRSHRLITRGAAIESVEMEPYYVLGPDGQRIEDPEHVTLLFTATTETPAGEVMTTKVGDQEVRIGKTDYILKSEYIEFSGGTIVDVQWEGLAEE